jgi:hypothetical protein
MLAAFAAALRFGPFDDEAVAKFISAERAAGTPEPEIVDFLRMVHAAFAAARESAIQRRCMLARGDALDRIATRPAGSSLRPAAAGRRWHLGVIARGVDASKTPRARQKRRKEQLVVPPVPEPWRAAMALGYYL